ncbi:hypothetical protein FPQ18DRAFT_308084 [Pyronema domesticum]|nr:hypothetical protein FPQ18DRAFT_308084 [Pyronema domesticum]
MNFYFPFLFIILSLAIAIPIDQPILGEVSELDPRWDTSQDNPHKESIVCTNVTTFPNGTAASPKGFCTYQSDTINQTHFNTGECFRLPEIPDITVGSWKYILNLAACCQCYSTYDCHYPIRTFSCFMGERKDASMMEYGHINHRSYLVITKRRGNGGSMPRCMKCKVQGELEA